MTILIEIKRLRARLVRSIPYPFIIVMGYNEIIGTPLLSCTSIVNARLARRSINNGKVYLTTRDTMTMNGLLNTIPRKVIVICMIVGKQRGPLCYRTKVCAYT